MNYGRLIMVNECYDVWNVLLNMITKIILINNINNGDDDPMRKKTKTKK